MMRKLVIALTAVAAVGCGGSKSPSGPAPTPTPDPNEPQATKDARVQFPTFLALQAGVISTTCSPNPGVCHNSSNYPNFETAGNTIGMVGSPCNVEIPDPSQGWDGCERLSDQIKLGSSASKLAFLTRIGPGTWHIGWKDPSPVGGSFNMTVLDHDGNVFFQSPAEWAVMVTTSAGGTEADVTVGGNDYIHDYVDGILRTVIGGDPNRNGVWGAEASGPHGAVFSQGSLDDSYMWQRITGQVPGSRMPLANAPLTEPAYVAIACWIQGLKPGVTPAPDDAIDYTDCAFGKNPVDWTVH